MSCWSKAGVLEKVFEELQRSQLVRIRIEAVCLDSTSIKVHPDGTGALKKGPQSIGKSRGGWTTKVHIVAADCRAALTFALSPGNTNDGPESYGEEQEKTFLLMDRAYEGDQTRQGSGSKLVLVGKTTKKGRPRADICSAYQKAILWTGERKCVRESLLVEIAETATLQAIRGAAETPEALASVERVYVDMKRGGSVDGNRAELSAIGAALSDVACDERALYRCSSSWHSSWSISRRMCHIIF